MDGPKKLVGHAVADAGRREYLILATKVGLEWNPEKTRVRRNASYARISQEIEESLRRLRTDYIDIYQVHWPDHGTLFEETMEGLLEVQCQGKIRFIGLSNFGVAQIERCLATGPIHVLQSPYNLFERGIEETVLPYCRSKRIGTLIYGPLCRGLLSGKYRGHETFSKGDVREMDPKFKGKTFRRYVACVERLSAIATPYGKTVGQMAIRWCLDQPGVTVALCSARRPEQIEDNAGGAGWLLSTTVEEAINRVVTDMIVTPDGPEFMGPP